MTANTEEKKFFEKNQIKFPKQYLLENEKIDCNNTKKYMRVFGNVERKKVCKKRCLQNADIFFDFDKLVCKLIYYCFS